MQLSAREAVLHDFNGKRGPYRAMQPRSIDCQARFFFKMRRHCPADAKKEKGLQAQACNPFILLLITGAAAGIEKILETRMNKGLTILKFNFCP
ncbi:MAG: hypothetical protein P4L91_07635 [Burkholderiaceae bacterium]|nr:hypothetical protein [Burkholderiaceae bacterium]